MSIFSKDPPIFAPPLQGTDTPLFTFPAQPQVLHLALLHKEDVPIWANEQGTCIFGHRLNGLSVVAQKFMLHILQFGGLSFPLPVKVNVAEIRASTNEINERAREALSHLKLPKDFALLKKIGSSLAISAASVREIERQEADWRKKSQVLDHKKEPAKHNADFKKVVAPVVSPQLQPEPAVSEPEALSATLDFSDNAAVADKQEAGTKNTPIPPKTVLEQPNRGNAKKPLNDLLEIQKTNSEWTVTIKSSGQSFVIVPHAWNESTKNLLQILWADTAFSVRVIGAAMGISHNAVVGMAHRNNLPSRGSPIIKFDETRPKPIQPLTGADFPKLQDLLAGSSMLAKTSQSIDSDEIVIIEDSYTASVDTASVDNVISIKTAGKNHAGTFGGAASVCARHGCEETRPSAQLYCFAHAADEHAKRTKPSGNSKTADRPKNASQAKSERHHTA